MEDNKNESAKKEPINDISEKDKDFSNKGPGGATLKKKSLGRKLIDHFLSDDPRGVGERVKNEVLWPGIKDLGYNILMSGISMAFWGEVRGGYGGRSGSRARDDRYEPYGKYSDSRTPANSNRNRRPSYDYGEIIFSSRDAANDALEYLNYLIKRFNQASVADLMERAELSSKYTDRYYGWYDLRNAGIYPTSEGWVLDLPPTEPLRTR